MAYITSSTVGYRVTWLTHISQKSKNVYDFSMPHVTLLMAILTPHS